MFLDWSSITVFGNTVKGTLKAPILGSTSIRQFIILEKLVEGLLIRDVKT